MDSEYYLPLIEDDNDEDYDVVCARCGATGLMWGKRRGQWAIFNPDGQDHCCASADDFEAFE